MNPSFVSVRAFVIGLTIAVAGAVLVTAQAQPMGPRGGDHGMHHGPGGDAGGSWHGRMLDQVNASEAQRTQIRQIQQAARADFDKLHEQGKALRERSAALFAQPAVDANAAEALRQQQMTLHDQVSRRRLQSMLEISRVLTPEQRQQIAQQRSKMREMHERHRRERAQIEPQRK
jgi:periplasmic protein CpxP/Spy